MPISNVQVFYRFWSYFAIAFIDNYFSMKHKNLMLLWLLVEVYVKFVCWLWIYGFF